MSIVTIDTLWLWSPSLIETNDLPVGTDANGNMEQVSANTDELSILRSFHAGANDFVKKPFSRHEVLARYESRKNDILIYRVGDNETNWPC
jgi:hypothetical protein